MPDLDSIHELPVPRARPLPARFGHPVPPLTTDEVLRWHLDRRASVAPAEPYPDDRRRARRAPPKLRKRGDA